MQVFARVEFYDRSFVFLTAESYAAVGPGEMAGVVDVSLVSERTTDADLEEIRARAEANRRFLSDDGR